MPVMTTAMSSLIKVKVLFAGRPILGGVAVFIFIVMLFRRFGFTSEVHQGRNETGKWMNHDDPIISSLLVTRCLFCVFFAHESRQVSTRFSPAHGCRSAVSAIV